MHDPQSLHKYLYVHGDPVNGIDPTGMFSLGGMIASIGISMGNFSMELATGALIVTLLETGGRAGFAARTAGLLFIADGHFDIGFTLYNFGSWIIQLTFEMIEMVDTALGLFSIGTLATVAAIKLFRSAPDLADAVLTFARQRGSSGANAASVAADAATIRPRFRYCFPEGTPVETANGPKSIETIHEGDVVKAWSFEKERIVDRPVKSRFVSFAKKLVEVQLSHGASLRTTAEHPFWVPGVGWKKAAELRVGDQLFTLELVPIEVAGLRDLDQVATVYNIEVEVDHNYFAGHAKVLTHNIHGSYNGAIAEALDWLRTAGVDTSKPADVVVGKFGPNKGKPIGVRFEGGGFYRIEYDAKSGAHINVGTGKIKGPHIQFLGNENTVNTVISQLFEC